MRAKVAVIGTGNIGTRHLQGLLKCPDDIDIYAVEPNLDARTHSLKMIETENKDYKCEIRYIDSIEKLPQKLDILIVATSSLVRREVVEEFLKNKKARYMVLEKVLFPYVSDYKSIGDLIKRRDVKTWVNCVKRSWEYSSILKEYYKSSNSVQMTVSGKMWGLACNAVHYIDLLSFLTDCCDTPIIDSSLIDNQIISSKRKGYIEFTGKLRVKIGNNNLELICKNGSFDGFYITLKNENIACEIVEKGENGINNVIEIDSGTSRQEAFKAEFQSNLTGKLVSELLRKGSCKLPDYDLATKWHIPLITALSEKAGLENGYCNIT